VSPSSIPKPSALTQANRLKTKTELFQIADATDPLRFLFYFLIKSYMKNQLK